MNALELRSWQRRLDLTDGAMATYIGVPVATWRKWAKGSREPDAAPQRLFDVLQAIERCAPALHADLLHGSGDASDSVMPSDRAVADATVAPTPGNASEPIPAWLRSALG